MRRLVSTLALCCSLGCFVDIDAGSESGSTDGSCTPGELGCNCVDGECLGTLVCDAGVCHAPDDSGSTSAGSSVSTSESMGSAEAGPGADTSTSADTATSEVTSTSLDTGSSSVSGVLDLAGRCEGEPSCGACYDCAVNGPCSDELATCQADPPCAALFACANECGMTDACVSMCSTEQPGGVALYAVFDGCVDCTCVSVCPAMCGG